MDGYINLLSPFTSFFEIAVGFNFAYAASKQLQDVVKSGFLYSARSLANLYEVKKSELEAKLEVMSDEEINSEQKKKIKEKLTKKLDQLRNEDQKLDTEIEDSQQSAANKIKPIYTFAALISLYFVLLCGYENISNTFPRYELFSILILSSLYVICAYILTFTNKSQITTIFSSMLAILFSLFSFVAPLELDSYISSFYIKNEVLLISSLVISFLPFILATFRLLLINILIEAKYRLRYIILIFEIYWLSRSLKSLLNSRNILKNFASSK